MSSTTTTATATTTTRLSDLPTPAFVINRHAFVKNCSAVLARASNGTNNNLRLRPHIKTHKTVQGAWIQVHGAIPMPTTETNPQQSIHLPTTPPPSSRVTGFVASTIPEIALLVDAVREYYPSLPPDILYGIPISASKLPMVHQLRQTELLDDVAMRTTTCRREHENNEHGEETRSAVIIPATWMRIHLLMDHVQQVTMVEDFCKTVPQTPPFSVYVKLDTGYHRAGITCDERGIRLIEAILESPHLDLKGVYTHW
jgi:hypothetical protein